MTTQQLTATQHAVLAYAIEHTSGKIDWFPENIKGGARRRVLDGLASRALIIQNGADWFVATEGYDALGLTRPMPASSEADPKVETDVATADAELATAKPRSRENNKQATVIQMLKRPDGATVRQICEATGWQAHTVRGTFAGAFKKKLGLTLTSDKPEGGERIYRIA